MKQITGFVILSALLAVSVFYIKYLRSENNRLEGLEKGYTEQIAEITKRAEGLEKISQEREQELQALSKSQKEFQNELEKAKHNKNFKNWFDSPLPNDVAGLFKKTASD